MVSITPAKMIVISTAVAFGKRNSVCIVNLLVGNNGQTGSPTSARQCSSTAPVISPPLPEYRNHFFAELRAITRRVESLQTPIDGDAEHRQISFAAVRKFARRV